MSGRGEYLGAEEVRSLIGKWQTIVGADDHFVDILGSEDRVDIVGDDVGYEDVSGEEIGASFGPVTFDRWGRPDLKRRRRKKRARVSDHRRLANAATAHRAVVMGDPVALGELEMMGAEEAMGAVADAREVAIAASQPAFPPRNQLVDRPGPSRADRVLLPMSSGAAILPNTSVAITSRPQNVAFRPERVIIGGDAGNWIVNDIKVGNRSQFSQSGDVPGETFAATTIDSFVSFETVQTAMDFVMLVTNINTETALPFYCSVLGTAAI